MSLERTKEIREFLFNLDRKIKPLEWDAGRQQINEFKLKELQRLKEEYHQLDRELKEIEQKSTKIFINKSF